MTDTITDTKSPSLSEYITFVAANNETGLEFVQVDNKIVKEEYLPHPDTSNYEEDTSVNTYTMDPINVQNSEVSIKLDEDMPIAQTAAERSHYNSKGSPKVQIINRKKKENLRNDCYLSPNPSAQQVYSLLNFLEANRPLALCTQRDAAGRRRSRKQWNTITVALNGMGGCVKTVQQWQRVWTDKKYLARKAGCRYVYECQKGNTPSIRLTPVELKILSIVEDKSVVQKILKAQNNPTYTLSPLAEDADLSKVGFSINEESSEVSEESDDDMPIAQTLAKKNGKGSSKRVQFRKKQASSRNDCYLSPNPSAEQVYALLNFLDANRTLARCTQRDAAGKMRSRKLWDTITVTLNGMGGCVKTAQQWQRVWTDKKYLAKKAARRYEYECQKGFTPSIRLTPIELKILSILDDKSVVLKGQNKYMLPPLPEDDDLLKAQNYLQEETSVNTSTMDRINAQNSEVSIEWHEDMPIVRTAAKRHSNSKTTDSRNDSHMSPNPSAQQVYALLNYLDANRPLARCTQRDITGRWHSRRQWDTITATLNGMGGCVKTVQQWQRVWTDKKYLAKKAARRYEYECLKGNTPSIRLSPIMLKILSIVDDKPVVQTMLTGQNKPAYMLPPFAEDADIPKVRRMKRIVASEEKSNTRLDQMEERRLEQGERLISEISGLREDIKEVHNLLRQFLSR